MLQPLVDGLKKALKSDFEKVVLALLMTPPEYDASEMKRAMKVQCFFFFFSIILLLISNKKIFVS